MRRALLLCLALFAAPVAAQEPPVSVVADSSAHSVVGQVAMIEGAVAEVRTHARRGSLYLNLGRRVRVTGQIWMQDGKWPAITVSQPIALSVAP